MKLGIIRSYADESFDFVKQKNLEFLEICTNNDQETEAFVASVPGIKANIARTGIPVGSVGRWNSAPNIGGKIDPAERDVIRRGIDATAEIGCSIFNLGVNYDESVSLYRNYCVAVDYLAEMSAYAKERGVTLALCNCDWNNFLCEDKTWEVVLSELPEVMIKYDCSHCYLRGGDYLAELHKWADRVVHVHIKGTARIGEDNFDDPPAGLDFLEWSKIFAILYAHRYNGGLSLEPHSGIWNGALGEGGIDFSINFIRPYIINA